MCLWGSPCGGCLASERRSVACAVWSLHFNSTHMVMSLLEEQFPPKIALARVELSLWWCSLSDIAICPGVVKTLNLNG